MKEEATVFFSELKMTSLFTYFTDILHESFSPFWVVSRSFQMGFIFEYLWLILPPVQLFSTDREPIHAVGSDCIGQSDFCSPP